MEVGEGRWERREPTGRDSHEVTMEERLEAGAAGAVSGSTCARLVPAVLPWDPSNTLHTAEKATLPYLAAGGHAAWTLPTGSNHLGERALQIKEESGEASRAVLLWGASLNACGYCFLGQMLLAAYPTATSRPLLHSSQNHSFVPAAMLPAPMNESCLVKAHHGNCSPPWPVIGLVWRAAWPSCRQWDVRGSLLGVVLENFVCLIKRHRLAKRNSLAPDPSSCLEHSYVWTFCLELWFFQLKQFSQVGKCGNIEKA